MARHSRQSEISQLLNTLTIVIAEVNRNTFMMRVCVFVCLCMSLYESGSVSVCLWRVWVSCSLPLYTYADHIKYTERGVGSNSYRAKNRSAWFTMHPHTASSVIWCFVWPSGTLNNEYRSHNFTLCPNLIRFSHGAQLKPQGTMYWVVYPRTYSIFHRYYHYFYARGHFSSKHYSN